MEKEGQTIAEDEDEEETVCLEIICEPPTQPLKSCLKNNQKNEVPKKVSFAPGTIDNSSQKVLKEEEFLDVLQRIEQETKKRQNFYLGSENDDDEFEDF